MQAQCPESDSGCGTVVICGLCTGQPADELMAKGKEKPLERGQVNTGCTAETGWGGGGGGGVGARGGIKPAGVRRGSGEGSGEEV